MPERKVLSQLYLQHFHAEPETITLLPKAGSDRKYYRLSGERGTAIGALNHDARENDTFIYLARHFRSRGVNVPAIYGEDESGLIYLQEDLGGTALYDLVRSRPFDGEVAAIYRKTLRELVRLQMNGAQGFDFSRCYPVQAFDKSSMFWDLNSFKYYFARTARAMFDEPSLQRDFHKFTDWLLQEPHQYFMMRDCQARNVMMKDGQPYFIDFQGGRKGAMQYDCASLLWQAGARIPMEYRESLLEDYINFVEEQVPGLDKTAFRERYYGYLLIRMLQVLGAYGFRGLFEGRQHFLDSIPPALDNISWFMQHITLPVQMPELYKILESLCGMDRFKPQKWNENGTAPLVVQVNSFSYKRGLPVDDSGNGGGFIFDCRGLHNPGRYEQYKALTGKDESVKRFLETESRVEEFLEHVFSVISINIETYLSRDFANLQVNFGCTGGQHRSVYCAEATAAFIRNKYNVRVTVRHIEQESKGNPI